MYKKLKINLKRKDPQKADQEKSLWLNCPECNQMQLKEDLKNNFNICKCSYHFDLDPETRFKKLLFDNGDYELIECPSWSTPDPLGMEINGKKFIDKYKNYQKKTGQQSALLIAHGKIGGIKSIAARNIALHLVALHSLREKMNIFLSAAQFAMENEIELFLSIYQSGGMSGYVAIFIL